MEKRHDYVLWFDECNLDSIPMVGGKNASLGELLAAEIPVPPGFAVTTKAYNWFLEQGGIKKEIFKILDGIQPNDMDSGEAASKKNPGTY
jgi:pyruvate, water dikinase